MSQQTHWIKVADLATLEEKKPAYALVKNTDLVLIKHEKGVSVLYGRCLHRGALMSDGHIAVSYTHLTLPTICSV